VLLVSIVGSRPPGPDRIARFEAMLRQRLGEERVRVVVRVAESMDITSKGRVLFGEAHFGALSAEDVRRQRAVEDAVRAGLEGLPNTFVTSIDAVQRESGWAVRADVVAPRVPAPGEVHDVEERARKMVDAPTEVTVRARTDVLVTDKEYRPAGEVQRKEQDAPVPGASLPAAASPDHPG
jgi:hypothetical protein